MREGGRNIQRYFGLGGKANKIVQLFFKLHIETILYMRAADIHYIPHNIIPFAIKNIGNAALKQTQKTKNHQYLFLTIFCPYLKVTFFSSLLTLLRNSTYLLLISALGMWLNTYHFIAFSTLSP